MALRLKLLGAVVSGFAKFVGGLERCGQYEARQGETCGLFAVLLVGLISDAQRLALASGSGTKKGSSDFTWDHLMLPFLGATKGLFELEMARFVDSSANRQSIVSYASASSPPFSCNVGIW